MSGVCVEWDILDYVFLPIKIILFEEIILFQEIIISTNYIISRNYIISYHKYLIATSLTKTSLNRL